MNRLTASLGTVIFLVIAPGFYAGLIPWLITRWRVKPSVIDAMWIKVVGAALIVLALGVILDSFARFALQGIGTPAPVLPTKHMVVSGLYRYVRNPLYLASVSLLLGQSLLFASLWLFAYAAMIWLSFHLMVVLYEEPTMREKFGRDYELFFANVPRWVPRFQSWTAST